MTAERDIPALLARIEAGLAEPHNWGRSGNDGLAFALAAVEAMTGRKPMGRISWTTRRGFVRILERHCTPDDDQRTAIEALLDKHFERVAPAMAMRGDIAGVADDEFGIAPMIVEGETLAGPGPKGQRRLPRKAMLTAWSATPPASPGPAPSWSATPRTEGDASAGDQRPVGPSPGRSRRR